MVLNCCDIDGNANEEEEINSALYLEQKSSNESRDVLIRVLGRGKFQGASRTFLCLFVEIISMYESLLLNSDLYKGCAEQCPRLSTWGTKSSLCLFITMHCAKYFFVGLFNCIS